MKSCSSASDHRAPHQASIDNVPQSDHRIIRKPHHRSPCVRSFENQYFAQVCRYKASLRHASGTYYDERRDIERAGQDGQLELFVYDDVTF